MAESAKSPSATKDSDSDSVVADDAAAVAEAGSFHVQQCEGGRPLRAG